MSAAGVVYLATFMAVAGTVLRLRPDPNRDSAQDDIKIGRRGQGAGGRADTGDVDGQMVWGD